MKRDRLVEEVRAGKRASMQGLTTEKLEGLGRGDPVEKRVRVLSGDERIKLWRSL